jgi:hypothetical protein
MRRAGGRPQLRPGRPGARRRGVAQEGPGAPIAHRRWRGGPSRGVSLLHGTVDGVVAACPRSPAGLEAP